MAFVDVATLDEHWHAADLVIECKSTTAPWVGFIGDARKQGVIAASYMDLSCALCDRMIRGFTGVRDRSPSAYAIVEKRGGGAKDHAYEGVQQVVSATLADYWGERWNGHEDESTISMMAIPIVVTDSPLYACSLDESGDVSLKPVDRINVAVGRLHHSDSTGLDVLVVRFTALEALIDELLADL